MTELARTRPESFFSDRFSITAGLMERVLGGNLIGKVDDADIYLEYRINELLRVVSTVTQGNQRSHRTQRIDRTGLDLIYTLSY